MKTIYSWKLNFERMMRAVEWMHVRLSESHRLKLNPATTYERSFSERITQEMIGMLGELAVIDFFGIKQNPGINTFHNVADVLDNIEVRSTNYKNGHLILRDNDKPDHKYIFCIVDYNAVKLIGWISGKEGMTDQHFRSEDKTKSMFKNPRATRPAWFIPQNILKDMKELKK
jgi:hypothetical protein